LDGIVAAAGLQKNNAVFSRDKLMPAWQSNNRKSYAQPGGE
jgi:hypothetical protein